MNTLRFTSTITSDKDSRRTLFSDELLGLDQISGVETRVYHLTLHHPTVDLRGNKHTEQTNCFHVTMTLTCTVGLTRGPLFFCWPQSTGLLHFLASGH